MYVLIIIGLIVVATAAPRQSQRIVGGSDTTVEEYPYIVNMQYTSDGSIFYHGCGGALITTQSVLSASHCYYRLTTANYKVALGATLTSAADGTTYTISRLILHERYNLDTTNIFDNDIAIVRIATPAVLSSKVALASIAGPNYILADGTMVTAIGYGRLYNDGPAPVQLQHVDVPTINQEVCSNRYAVLNGVTPGMACVGYLDEGGMDFCSGDSGGPVAHGPNKDIIFGVVSWGACGSPIFPGVTARVSHYTDWILANAV